MAPKSISLHNVRGLTAYLKPCMPFNSEQFRGLNFRVGLLTHKTANISSLENFTCTSTWLVLYCERPSEEIFEVLIFAFQCKKPHPPQALHVKYWCVELFPSLNFRVNCSALEKCGNFLHHAKISHYTTYVLLTLCIPYLAIASRPGRSLTVNYTYHMLLSTQTSVWTVSKSQNRSDPLVFSLAITL